MFATAASVWRMRILSEPESAQAKIGEEGMEVVHLESEFMIVADSDDWIIEELVFRTSFELFLSLIKNILSLSSLLWPCPQLWRLILKLLPPGTSVELRELT
jgi:hypothetical protein